MTKKTISYIYQTIFSICILTGCVGIGIPKTDNPYEKLKWAEAAIFHGRPMPARNLILEAIDEFSETNNQLMLGVAYNLYGIFELTYRDTNKSDYSQAVIYFKTSLSHFKNYEDSAEFDPDDALYEKSIQHATNSAYNLGELMQLENDDIKACKYFDLSSRYYKIQRELRPDKPVKAVGYNNFSEAIEDKMHISKCSK